MRLSVWRVIVWIRMQTIESSSWIRLWRSTGLGGSARCATSESL